MVLQLLAPFIAGQIARGWIAPWLARRGALTGYVDRGSILLVVYGAFSAAVVEGIWRHVSAAQFLAMFVACAVLLGVVLTTTMLAARALGFDKADEITICLLYTSHSSCDAATASPGLVRQGQALPCGQSLRVRLERFGAARLRPRANHGAKVAKCDHRRGWRRSGCGRARTWSG